MSTINSKKFKLIILDDNLLEYNSSLLLFSAFCFHSTFHYSFDRHFEIKKINLIFTRKK